MATVIDLSNGVEAMMKSLGFVGSFDVRYEGSRSTGWVGKPGDGDDMAFSLTVVPLPPLDEAPGGG